MLGFAPLGALALGATQQVHTVGVVGHLIAEPGVYTLIGNNAILSRGHALPAEPGVYILTGSPATLSIARTPFYPDTAPGKVALVAEATLPDALAFTKLAAPPAVELEA